MQFNLLEIWEHMGILNKGIAVTLIVMGLSYLTVLVERMFVLGRMSKNSAKFSEEAMPLLAAGKFKEMHALAEENQGSDIAVMISAVLNAYMQNRAGGKLTPLERAQRELHRFGEMFGARLRRGMPIVATVGSISPFVGLLGTVVGIIVAFQTIGSAGSAGLAAVTVGIAEALVETALGLLIAIPAVMAYNFLTTKIDKFEANLTQTSDRLIEFLEDLGHGSSAR